MSTRTTAPTAVLVVYRLAALFTFLAVAMGAVVCATASGAACPTWPGCLPGQFAPHWQLSPLIEFTHRGVAIAAGPLVLAAAVLSRRLAGPDRRVRILPWVALAGAVAAGVFGRLVVLSGIPVALGALDLFAALTSMTAMGVAAVLVASRRANSAVPVRPGLAPPRRLAATSVVAVVAVHVSGIFLAAPGSYTRCLGWPVWRLVAADGRYGWQNLRLGLAAVAAVLVTATAVAALRAERVRRLGVVLLGLFATEMLLGLVIRAGAPAVAVAATHSVLAVALLWCLALLTAVTWGRAGTVGAPPVRQRPGDTGTTPVPVRVGQ